MFIGDDLSHTLLKEITEKGSQSGENLRKENCAKYIRKYKEQFGLEKLAQMAVEVFYASKIAKRDKSYKKKILGNMNLLEAYLEKYISEENITTQDMREMKDLL